MHRVKLDFEPWVVRMAPSGIYVITERGIVLLPDGSPPSSPLLFATRTWIQEDGEDIVAIPSAYQGSGIGINGHTVTFWDREQGPVFLRLDEGIKAMT